MQVSMVALNFSAQRAYSSATRFSFVGNIGLHESNMQRLRSLDMKVFLICFESSGLLWMDARSVLNGSNQCFQSS